MKKVWVTKYALIGGIFQVGVRALDSWVVVHEFSDRVRDYYHKPDWHDTHEEAVLQAIHMRNCKITSLKRQLAKLQALTF